MLSFSQDTKSEFLKAFNSTSRSLNYLLNIDNNFIVFSISILSHNLGRSSGHHR